MNNIISSVKEVRNDIVDVTNFVEDYVSNHEILQIMERPISKLKGKDTIKDVGMVEALLKDYEKYMEYITDKKYIDILTSHTSDTYSGSYIKKTKIIQKNIESIYKELRKHVETLDISLQDISNLSGVIMSAAPSVVKKYIDKKDIVEKIKDNLLGLNTTKPSSGMEPIFTMGLDFGLKPVQATVFKPVPHVKEVTTIKINHSQSAYTVYDIDMMLSPVLVDFKRSEGISIPLIDKMNNIHTKTGITPKGPPTITIHPGNKNNNTVSIFETFDGVNYRTLKVENGPPSRDYVNIIKGPKYRVFMYNKLTEEVLGEPTSSTRDIWLQGELDLPGIVFVDIQEYKNKTEEEIYSTLPKKSSGNVEEELINLYKTLSIKREVFKMRNVENPRIQFPYFGILTV